MKSTSFWIRFGIGATAILILANTIDWRGAVNQLLNISLPWLIVACALNALAIVISALRWWRLVAVQGSRLGAYDSIRLYWIGGLFSTVLPTNIGGDAVRVAMAKRYGSISSILASIVVERISGLLILAGLVAIALLFLPQIQDIVPAHNWVIVGLFAILFLGPAIGFSMMPMIMAWLRKLKTKNKIINLIVDKAHHFINAINLYRGEKFELTISVAISLLFYLTLVIFQAVTILTVGGDVTMKAALIAAPMVLLVSALPISINGLGVSEGVFVLLYVQMGTTPEAALAAAVLRRLIITGVAAFGFFFWLQERKDVDLPEQKTA